MTHVIDAITHQLTGMHIAMALHEHFHVNESSEPIQLVSEPGHHAALIQAIRTSSTRLFDREGVSKENRYGLRVSEPFPFTFPDGRVGRFMCLHITPYYSPRNAMIKAVSLAMEGMSL